jgi:hypothetical protein
MFEKHEDNNIVISNEEKLPSKQQTGNLLKLHGEEMKLMNSGSLGAKRLAQARSFDIQENFPNISEEDANKIGAGYVMLKYLAINGKLTESTKAEVNRLEAKNSN